MKAPSLITQHAHWPPTAGNNKRTIRLTKKGEGMARAIKLSRIAKLDALLDEWFRVSRLRVVSK